MNAAALLAPFRALRGRLVDSRVPRTSARGWIVMGSTLALAIALTALGLSWRVVDYQPGDPTVASRAWMAYAAERPADSDPRWRQVRLPHAWRTGHPGTGPVAWYRIEWSIVPSREPALYIPIVASTVEVWSDGRRLWRYPAPPNTVVNLLYEAQVIPLPAELFADGRKGLDLKVMMLGSGFAAISRVMLADQDTVQSRSSFRRAWHGSIALAAALVTIAIGALFLVLWLFDRRDGVHAWFGIFCVAEGVRNLRLQVTVLPFGVDQWNDLILGSLGLTSVLFFLFCRRLTGGSFGWIDRAVMLYPLVAPLLPFLSQEFFIQPRRYFWIAPFTVLQMIAVVLVIWHLRRTPGVVATLVSVVGAVHIAAILRDPSWLLINAANDVFLFRPVTEAMFAVAVAVLLIDRATKARRELASANVALRHHVDEVDAELARSQARLIEAEREAAAIAERERLLREIHDGVGSQLGLLQRGLEQRQLAPEAAARLARETMEELRLTLDIRRDTNGTLMSMLAGFRYRLQPHLQASGVELVWQPEDGAETVTLTPTDALNVLRIVQEAIGNAVEHGRARKVSLRLAGRQAGHGPVIEIADDGVGFDRAPAAEEPSAGTGRGRGLANMRQRASALGATLEFLPRPEGGTMVRLTLP